MPTREISTKGFNKKITVKLKISRTKDFSNKNESNYVYWRLFGNSSIDPASPSPQNEPGSIPDFEDSLFK